MSEHENGARTAPAPRVVASVGAGARGPAVRYSVKRITASGRSVALGAPTPDGVEVHSWPVDDLYTVDGEDDASYSALRERWGPGFYRVQFLDEQGRPVGARRVRLLGLEDDEEDGEEDGAEPSGAPSPAREAAALMRAIDERAQRDVARATELARAMAQPAPTDMAQMAQLAELRAELARAQERERLRAEFGALLAQRDAQIAELSARLDGADDDEPAPLIRDDRGLLEGLILGVAERALQSEQTMAALAELMGRVVQRATTPAAVAAASAPPAVSTK